MMPYAKALWTLPGTCQGPFPPAFRAFRVFFLQGQVQGFGLGVGRCRRRAYSNPTRLQGRSGFWGAPVAPFSFLGSLISRNRGTLIIKGLLGKLERRSGFGVPS